MKIEIQDTSHLTADERAVVESIATTSWYKSLEQFYAECVGWLGSEWFVYRGGHHVAIHRHAGDDRRVILATE